MTTETIKLTQYSHGAGCGCKISPAILDQILRSNLPPEPDTRLLVGNSDRDDAAVYDLGNGSALISTTDFFMPIVDDPGDFGKVAAANAISDVYAMGGKPVLAIAILGWPVDKLPASCAREVLEGARSICSQAGISLAGGHSIDCPEPVFGLSVNGLVDIGNLKQNSTATAGCLLYLTKPLGVGVLTTAQRKGLLRPEHEHLAFQNMARLNKVGEAAGRIQSVKAMTDVTGFGLLGHLSEMCEGSKLSADIQFDKVPRLDAADEYLEMGSVPGGTHRNWSSYGHRIGPVSERQKMLLADPQTSGGLLIAVEEAGQEALESLLRSEGIPEENIIPFGRLDEATGPVLIRIH